MGPSCLEDFLEGGEGPVKIKKHLRKRHQGDRGPYLELLPALRLLTSVTAGCVSDLFVQCLGMQIPLHFLEQEDQALGSS